MTCEVVREELVAYRDGELLKQDRERIAAHLKTCAECAREEAQLTQVEQLLAKMERITPSPDFAANFWKRLEQEKTQVEVMAPSIPLTQESHFTRWRREFWEFISAWRIAPALAAAASLLVFFGYLFTSGPTSGPQPISQSQPQQPTVALAPPEVPAELTEKLGLFENYKVIADLDRFAHFDDIAAVKLPDEQGAAAVAKEDDLPPELLQNPSFFAHYPMLKSMEKLQNLEAVLDTPTTKEDPQQRG